MWHFTQGSPRSCLCCLLHWVLRLFPVVLAPLIQAQELRLITDFHRFWTRTNREAGREIWESSLVRAREDWDSLIVSWNATTAGAGGLEFQVQVVYPERATAYYSLGVWAESTNAGPRHSVENQKDRDGRVATDTLKLEQPGRALRLRLQFPAAGSSTPPQLRLVALSYLNSRRPTKARSPDREAWGRVLPVPQISQHAFPGGKVWCSPTSLAMVLGYWSTELQLPELQRAVPEVAVGVYDAVWKGTGNWPFNTAYAGRFPALRAYVTRLRDLRAVEESILRKRPVILSVALNRLRQRPATGDDGHLVVVTGFSATGDVWINDPDAPFPPVAGRNVARLYPREAVEAAWAASQRTVYLVEPVVK